MEMRKALVTGGLGFIGSQIARRILAENVVDQVVLLDHFGGYMSPMRAGFTDWRRLRLRGLEDKVVIERAQANYANVVNLVLRRHRPTHIFHLAALPLASLENINMQEALEGSVVSTGFLLETCAMMKDEGYKLERFVYTSSSMVYGNFEYAPADELHPTRPIEVYGAAKLAGEAVALGMGRRFGLPVTVIRPSAVYGPTDMNRRVTQIFVENALLGKRLVVNGADDALDFTYVADTAAGFVLAAVAPEAVGEVFNITSGRAFTLLEFVTALKEFVPDLQYEVAPRDQTRPRRGTLSTEKAQKLLGYKPSYDLQRGIGEYVEFQRKHWLPDQVADKRR
jgi:nucleoside-diphosphate-sugar epimerase